MISQTQSIILVNFLILQILLLNSTFASQNNDNMDYSSPPFESTNTNPKQFDQQEKSGMSGGIIALIVVASILLLITIIVCMVCIYLRCRSNNRRYDLVSRDDVGGQNQQELNQQQQNSHSSSNNNGNNNGNNNTNLNNRTSKHSQSDGRDSDLNSLTDHNSNSIGIGKRIQLYHLNGVKKEVVIQEEGEPDSGGFGVVYKVRRENDNTVVAMKRAKEKGQNDIMNEFVQLVGLRHPNVIKGITFGFDDRQRPVLLMEYMRGGTLKKHLPDIDRRREIMRQLIEAVKYLHSRGVVHCDLKPTNVLLDSWPGWRALVVSDFGISRHTHTVATGKPGTKPYWPPEHEQETRQSKPWDVWALGCIIFELYQRTSQRRFGHQMLQIVYEAEMHDLLRRCWEIDPSKRTIEEVDSFFREVNEKLIFLDQQEMFSTASTSTALNFHTRGTKI